MVLDSMASQRIRDEALKCQSLLRSCVEQFEGSRLEMAREQVGRFNLWTSNIGVFARYPKSLDYRLHDASDITEVIIRMLDVLGVCIHHGEFYTT
jgi:hypothetical protein